MSGTKPTNLKVSYPYIEWLLRTNRAIMGHFYQFQSVDGSINDYFTDMDVDVVLNGALWKANSLRIEGLHMKLGIGTTVDEQSVKIWANPGDTLFGGDFLTEALDGLLDGVLLVRYRVVWQLVTGDVATDITYAPQANWTMFTGYIGQIEKGGKSHIEVKCKSALLRLNVNMPRNYYQPGCLWTLFDFGCTLLEGNYAMPGYVSNPPTTTVLPVWTGATPLPGVQPSPVGPDNIPFYAQGKIKFMSGTHNGLITLIDTNDALSITLAYPLDTPAAVGDQFIITPGCSKSFITCQQKYGNQHNFRGFDKVPPVMVSA